MPTEQDLFATGSAALHRVIAENNIDEGDMEQLFAKQSSDGDVGEVLAEAVIRSLGIPLDQICDIKDGQLRTVRVDVPPQPLATTDEEIASLLWRASQNYANAKDFSEQPDWLRSAWLLAAEAARTYVAPQAPAPLSDSGAPSFDGLHKAVDLTL